MKSVSEKVLVIGAQGFIGSALTRSLQRETPYIVHNISNSLEYFATFKDLIKNEQFKNIFWMAGKANPYLGSRHPYLIIEETEQFVEAIERVCTYQRDLLNFFFLSSGGCIYSPSEHPHSEESSLKPRNEYGSLKTQQESILIKSSLPHSILRVSNVFGPKQPTGRGQGIIGEWLLRIYKGEICEIYGSTQSFRDYLHIKDLIQVLLQAIKAPPLGIVNIGSAEKVTLQQLIKLFQLHFQDKYRYLVRDVRLFDSASYSLDISKVTRLLNWVPLNSGIKGIESFLRNESTVGK